MIVVSCFEDSNTRVLDAMTSAQAAQVVEKVSVDGRTAVIRQ